MKATSQIPSSSFYTLVILLNWSKLVQNCIYLIDLYGRFSKAFFFLRKASYIILKQFKILNVECCSMFCWAILNLLYKNKTQISHENVWNVTLVQCGARYKWFHKSFIWRNMRLYSCWRKMELIVLTTSKQGLLPHH